MPRPRVYVETTIPSSYFEQRRDPLMVAKRRWTRVWWEVALDRYEIVTSPVTTKELEDGPDTEMLSGCRFYNTLRKWR